MVNYDMNFVIFFSSLADDVVSYCGFNAQNSTIHLYTYRSLTVYLTVTILIPECKHTC